MRSMSLTRMSLASGVPGGSEKYKKSGRKQRVSPKRAVTGGLRKAKVNGRFCQLSCTPRLTCPCQSDLEGIFRADLRGLKFVGALVALWNIGLINDETVRRVAGPNHILQHRAPEALQIIWNLPWPFSSHVTIHIFIRRVRFTHIRRWLGPR